MREGGGAALRRGRLRGTQGLCARGRRHPSASTAASLMRTCSKDRARPPPPLESERRREVGLSYVLFLRTNTRSLNPTLNAQRMARSRGVPPEHTSLVVVATSESARRGLCVEWSVRLCIGARCRRSADAARARGALRLGARQRPTRFGCIPTLDFGSRKASAFLRTYSRPLRDQISTERLWKDL